MTPSRGALRRKTEKYRTIAVANTITYILQYISMDKTSWSQITATLIVIIPSLWKVYGQCIGVDPGGAGGDRLSRISRMWRDVYVRPRF